MSFLDGLLSPKMLSGLVDKFLTDEKITPQIEEFLIQIPVITKAGCQHPKNIIVFDTVNGETWAMVCTRSWNMRTQVFEISKPIKQMKFTEIIKLIIDSQNGTTK